MRRYLVPLLVLLAFPATAQAGGWATVGLSSTPTGTTPGKPWKVDLEILQHGRTPLENVKPAVIVRDASGKETRFDATATKKPGVYSVAVTFPEAGEYTYVVDDGFVGPVHEFAPVTIGEAPAVPAAAIQTPADDGGFPWLALGLGLVGAMALAAAAFTLTRRRGQLAA